ncbi:MAG: ABC transporter substrate-binding protein [Acidimicrobiales bacterium]|jgi:peptide/nickel transport system substrate-binding protein
MRKTPIVVTLFAVSALATALFSSTTAASTKTTSTAMASGGVANFAEPPGEQPTYIFPLLTCPADTSQNIGTFQNLLFEPLFSFASGSSVALNESTSLAYPPTYSDNNQEVTIRLKPYKWSNGESVDADDILFWQNLITANVSDDCNFSPGTYPLNITAVKVDSSSEVTFKLNRSYSPTWFTYNELSQVTPLPAAWDLVAAGKKSDCDTDKSACTSVYKYLSGQANELAKYASNPLWQIVDGPWKLTSFSVDGAASFVPNKSYSGSDKPHLSQFNELPFTTDAAEYDTLRAGNSIQVGYIPIDEAPAKGGSNPAGSGYTMAPWPIWGFNYIPFNLHNPKVGPIFAQTYFRDAMQYLLDQQGVVTDLLKGYGSVTSGPIPDDVSSSYLPAAYNNDPFPYSPSNAKKLLVDHGWHIVSGGTTTCARPGSAADDCGAGIAKGASLVFNMVFANAPPWVGESMQNYKADAASLGIQINLSSAPSNSVIGDISVCKPTQPSCSWELLNWGTGWTYFPDYYPTGEDLFKTGSGENDGSYSNARMDTLIDNSDYQPGQASLNAYEQYVRQQTPVLWQPEAVYQISEVASDLHGVLPQSPLNSISPQDWYFTK